MTDTSKSGSILPAYFVRAALWYGIFNIVISPSSLWKEIFSGWRYGHGDLLLLPFVQGSVFFYAIVLNSDSIFRALHGAVVLNREYTPPKIWGVVAANFILIILTFWDIDSRQEEIATRMIGHSASGLPCQSAMILPAVADQIFFLVLALIAGSLMNHYLTQMETVHLNPSTNGGH
ncbi:MAG: hypothetical protein WAN35_14150 [Terracidiphilus sp.]